jgi:hypothetical protein
VSISDLCERIGFGGAAHTTRGDETMNDQKQLRGPELLCAAVNQILAHPDTWNQTQWHCGTAHCIAGHCEMLTGGPTSDTARNVRELVGLSYGDADFLFARHRTLPEIYAFAKTFRDGYDSAGYDRDGYDSAGYDSAGYDSDGYDRAGKQLEMTPFVLK